MPQGIQIFDPAGNIVLDDDTKALEVQSRTLGTKGASISYDYVPASKIKTGTQPAGTYSGHVIANAYSKNLNFGEFLAMRSTVIGDTCRLQSIANNNDASFDVSLYYTSGLGTSGNIEFVTANAALPTHSSGFMEVYDEAGNLSWSLNSLINCVRILHIQDINTTYVTQPETTYLAVRIPDDVPLDTVYVVPPYEVMQVANGTVWNMASFFWDIKDRYIHIKILTVLNLTCKVMVVSIPKSE